MTPLSETEKAYLVNNERFSKRKQKYLRYRMRQKPKQRQETRRRDAAETVRTSRDGLPVVVAITEATRPLGHGVSNDIYISSGKPNNCGGRLDLLKNRRQPGRAWDC